VTKHWIDWHADYEKPDSSLARRLEVVRAAVAAAIDYALRSGENPEEQLRIISMCAGDGRDLLPVLARSARGRQARVVLVELDDELCRRAHSAAAELELPAVEVRCTDAGTTDAYVDLGRAHVLLCCGVFGNIALDDARRTITRLPAMLVPGATVIWTRGRSDADSDPSLDIREMFEEAGFERVSFVAPDDANYRVGVHRLRPDHMPTAPLRAGERLFSFG
jgi:hypothetical protein